MFEKGMVILVPFPFTDLSGSKVRPAIIISNAITGNDVVVVFVTSKKEKLGAYEIEIQASKDTGLKVDSRVKCTKIATLDTKIILGELGMLSKQKQKEIDACLKKIFLL